MKTFAFSLAAALLLTTPALHGAPPKPVTFTQEQLQAYDAVQGKLDPMAAPLLPQLRQAYPGQTVFTEYEIAALKGEGKKVDVVYHPERVSQKGKPPRDTFSASEADGYLAFVQKQNKAKVDFPKVLRAKYGKQDWYLAAQVRDVAENGEKKRQIEGALPAEDPVYLAQQRIQPRANGLIEGFRSPRIRENWRDVLYEEDPSQPENAAKSIGDLVGATFSYNHNGLDDSDTWRAIGALILPWQYERPEAGGWGVEKLALAPSLGINKVDTSGNPALETDQLTYRLGLYAQWSFPTETGSGVQVRGSGVYLTDTDGEAELPGYEVDIEPRWNLRYFPIGYRRVVIYKKPVKKDGSDMSALEYQLRVWLHAEGGEVQHAGLTWDPANEDFFRLGPVVQLTVKAPYLFFGRDFSLTALYSYLEPVEGRTDHTSYFSSTASLNLYRNERLGHRVSLNMNYQKGGLNFTKEEVDSLTIGLGVLF